MHVKHLDIMLAKIPVQKSISHSATIGGGRIRVVEKDDHFA